MLGQFKFCPKCQTRSLPVNESSRADAICCQNEKCQWVFDREGRPEYSLLELDAQKAKWHQMIDNNQFKQLKAEL